MAQLILASQSPRRRRLIKLFDHAVQATTAAVDEESVSDPDPARNAVKTAQLKARAVAPVYDDVGVIVAADTTVALDNIVLGKPEDAQQAMDTLQRLRRRIHEVHTGLVLIDVSSRREISSPCTTRVTMRDYSDQEIEAYIATGDPFDKAGAYAIQHTTFDPVARIQGCYSNVVGLPLCRLKRGLQELGITSELEVDQVTSDYRRCATCLALLENGV